VLVSSICIWIFHFTVLRGVQQAAAINKVVAVAKVVPIPLFILILAVSFKGHLFAANFWGGEGMPEASLFEQVRGTMLVTVFVFLGIEGASVYSRYAQKRSDVGTATIFGFIGVTTLMVLVTLLSYAVLLRAEIAGLRQPSMATVLEAVVGHWGLVFISLGLIVSVLGAYLAWQMIAAEVLFNAARPISAAYYGPPSNSPAAPDPQETARRISLCSYANYCTTPPKRESSVSLSTLDRRTMLAAVLAAMACPVCGAFAQPATPSRPPMPPPRSQVRPRRPPGPRR
jgi:hypothetical protein